MNTYFYIPDFYWHYNINIKLIDLIKSNPEYFEDGINIGGVYGYFPKQIWNSGRINDGQAADFYNIKSTIDAFNLMNIPITFTYTNSQLTKEDCYDEYCNLITDLAAKSGINEININSLILEEYLRARYGDAFRYSSSITKCISNIEDFNNESKKDYDKTVLLTDLNREEYWERITYPEKAEICLNEFCMFHCTKRKQHYDYLSMRMKDDTDEVFECPYQGVPSGGIYETLDSDREHMIVSRNKLYNYLIPNGFKHFKIVGRTVSHPDLVEFYVYYLVKPRWRNKVRLILLKSI